MLIERFVLPEAEASLAGLAPIDMPRLGRYIVVAGKNGSGKTRLLNHVYQAAVHRTQSLANLPNLRQQLIVHENALKNDPNNPEAPRWRTMIDNFNKDIARIIGRVIAADSRRFNCVRFVPKKLDLSDPRSQSRAQIKKSHDQALEAGLENYSQLCLGYMQYLQDCEREATHQTPTAPLAERQKVISAYETLEAILIALFGTSVARDLQGNMQLYGRPAFESGLSDGQKIVLQLAVAIHAQSAKLNNTVFVLDELENHLHPSVAIDVLERIERAAPDSQIWIATHSVPLLAYIVSKDPMAVWYMEEGKVSHAGRHPEQVLKGLLGDEERIGQLHNLTGLPAQLASVNYAA